ncbi:hypothetical protein ACROYT_G012896 [Oculina patagonica]
MAFVSHKVSVISLLSLFAMSLLVYCATASNKTNQPSYKMDCVFTKNFYDTALHVYWTGALRIYHCDSCCKRWYFTFNGAECAAPLTIEAIVYMAKGSGSNLKNLHRVRHIEGWCFFI